MKTTTSLSSIELTLHRIKRFGLGNSSKAVAKCVQDLRDAACSTELKLEALESWQQQGLLDDIDAFKPLVEELLVASPDHSLSPQTPAPQPPEQDDSHTEEGQRTDAAGLALEPPAPEEQLEDLQQQQQQQQQQQPVAPLSVEAVYDAARTYRTGLDVAPLVKGLKISDTTFASTVDSVRFQEEGVALMLQQETVPRYLQLQLDGQTRTLQLPPGSLLFDQMGLGKTIQALALILANPQRKGEAGTLLIVPEVIVSQVVEELELHSNLRVLHYTGLAKHLLQTSAAASSDKHHKYTDLTMARLKEQHKEAQKEAAKQARARGEDAATAAAAVEMPAFSTLQQKFDMLLRTLDVIVMSSADAMTETRYHAATLRGSRSSSKARYMQSPLYRLEFKRVIVDEAQQLGSTSTRLFELTTLIKAQHKMVMSGTPFPTGREAALMTSLLQFVFSSSTQAGAAETAAAAAAAATAGGAPIGEVMEAGPTWLASVVAKAMKPCRDPTAAREAQQVLLALLSRLVIRRTLFEVVRDGYTVPRQHHSLVVVQPQYTCAFMLELLKAAAKQALDAPEDELDPDLVPLLYNRLVGASIHPQFDALVNGGQQVLDRWRAFTDPFLPMRNGVVTNVFPQDIMAGIVQDTLQLDMVRRAAELAAAARGWAASLSSLERPGGPDMPGARQVVRSALDSIQSCSPMFPDDSGSAQPLSLQQLDARRSSSDTAASEDMSDVFSGMRGVAFAGIKTARTAYQAAMVDFNSEMASLRSLNRQLNMPAAAAAAAAAAATADAAAGAAGAPGAADVHAAAPEVGVLQLKLQQAETELHRCLGELISKAPLQHQVQQWGGSEQQWQEIAVITQTGLDAEQMHVWFGKIKKQRQVLLEATQQLQQVPPTCSLGLVSAKDYASYKDAFQLAQATMKVYHDCFDMVNLLKSSKLDFARPEFAYVGNLDKTGREWRMSLVFDAVLEGLLEHEDLSDIVQGWKAVWEQLFAERKTAQRAINSAGLALKAAAKLAPRLLQQPAEWLEDEVERLTLHMLELRSKTYPQVQRLVQGTNELARSAAAGSAAGRDAVELAFGSLLAEAATILRSPELQDKQVVVVTSNKQLYFEVLQMLALVGIKNEHLDADSWTFEEPGNGSGSRQRARSRREGLRNFRSGVARVLVLNLLDEQQAYGITLTNAHHMLVLDPVMSEPLLHQVLSRIHRYGQKQEQHVTFLTVQGSINKLLHDRFVANYARKFLDRQQGEEQQDTTSPADGAAAAAGAASDGVDLVRQAGVSNQGVSKRALGLLREYCFGRAP